MVAALGQAAVLAAVLILLPLAPGIGAMRSARGRPATLGYFLLLGAGFMLLEMSFLQKLILYLAHPIYSAAAVISGFLVFAGLGSQLSRRWAGPVRRVPPAAAVLVVALAAAYLAFLDDWLKLTQSQPIWLRLGISAVTIAPLAVAMGHMFPAGLRQVSSASGVLVPWAWAVNGFASVAAAVAAPLLAMHVGFAALTGAAMACYALAGVVSLRLPGANRPARPESTAPGGEKKSKASLDKSARSDR